MSRGRRRQRRRVVVVFGEDESDTKAIAELIQALCPQTVGMVRARREPPVLIRDASVDQVASRAERIVDAVRAEEAVADVLCVFAHEDCDDVEPGHDAVAKKIEDAMAAAGRAAHAVVPAWEIEAWWFLFPEAVAGVNGSWDRLDGYAGRSVGLIGNAKEELQRALRRTFDANKRKRVRTYRGSDSPAVAAKVRELGLANAPSGRSASYDRFRDSVRECCAAQG